MLMSTFGDRRHNAGFEQLFPFTPLLLDLRLYIKCIFCRPCVFYVFSAANAGGSRSLDAFIVALSQAPGGGAEVLVHIYPGATAGITGVLQGMQKHPVLARACPESKVARNVVSSITASVRNQPVEGGSHLESRAGRACSPFDVGAPDGRSGEECRDRAVDTIESSLFRGTCFFN